MKTCKCITLIVIIITVFNNSNGQTFLRDMESFKKIIIGPHINATLIKSDSNLIIIENSNVSFDKIITQIEGQTLKIYLDKSKIWPQTYRIREGKHNKRIAYNRGADVDITVYYKDLRSISFRGEKELRCFTELNSDNKFKITLFGETRVTLKAVNAEQIKIKTYGENKLTIEQGSVNKQIVKSYGENEINTSRLISNDIKSKSYSESNLSYYCINRLKVFSIGGSKITCYGNCCLQKALIIGDNEICMK